jgi:CHAT domain-containing protein/Tfp pilus assembly protein PilF
MKKIKNTEYLIVKYFTISLVCAVIYSCATPSILVTQEQNKGDMLFNQHNYPEAILHYNLMLDASSKLGIYRNPEMEADVNRKIANCYEMTGDYPKALIHVRMAMEIDSAGNNLLGRIEDLRQEGKVFIYLGNYNRSIKSLEKALSLSAGMDQSIKGINQQAIADNYLTLGQLYTVLGKSQLAVDNLQKANDIFKQNKDLTGELEANLALGSVWSDYGFFDIARNYISKSIDLAVEQKLGTARQNQLMANILSSAGEYEEAMRWLQNALEEANKNKITAQIIWANIGVGDLYNDLGDPKRAERYYKAAKQVKDSLSDQSSGLQASLDMRMGEILNARDYFSSQGSITGEAISLIRIADLMINKSSPDSALKMLGQSQSLFKSSQNHMGVAHVQLLKGRVYSETGKYMQGLQVLDSALKYIDFPELVWQAWYIKGIIYENQDELEKASESYMNSVSAIEKIRGKLSVDEFKSSYFRNKIVVYDRLIRLLIKMNKSEEAFQVSEKARSRAFYDILAGRKINYRGAMPGDLTQLEQLKRNEIEKLYKLIQKEGSSPANYENASRQTDLREIRTALAQVQEEYEDILQKMKLENPEYKEIITAEPVRIQDLQSKIDKGSAIISYWVSEKELIIWFITNAQISRKIAGINRKELTAVVEKTRNAIKSNSLKNSDAALRELSAYLIVPISSELKSVQNLVIIPNGCLNFIPFQALINETGQYLIDKHNITYSPSASIYLLNTGKEPPKGSRFLGMALGDISVENNVGLPGTEDELKKIIPLFTDKLTTIGEKSTESYAKRNSGDFNFIHFATHGIYNYKQPLYSFLLFPPSDNDDGRLNVWEVFEMNLHSKLVTLSACETGLGNLDQGDELIGLSRAFLYAGSSAVIVSLWSVADYPTAILMSNFYKYIRDHSLEEALTMAQKDVLKQYPQPLYWSPFILIGNGKTHAD